MRGIPMTLSTKDDFINTHIYVKHNRQDKNLVSMWINRLESYIEPIVIKLPILSKKANYIILPYSDIDLSKYKHKVGTINGLKCILLYIKTDDDFFKITTPNKTINEYGLTTEDINRMIDEVRSI